MFSLFILLGLITFVGTVTCSAFWIIRKNKKENTKSVRIMSVSFILLLVISFGGCVATVPDPEPTNDTTNVISPQGDSSINDTETKKEEEARIKAAEDEKAQEEVIEVVDNTEEVATKVSKKQFRGITELKYEAGYLYINAEGKDTYSGNKAQVLALKNISTVLEAISGTTVEEVEFYITLPFKGDFGNVEEGLVLKLLIDRETLDKINWKEFDYNKLPDIAKTYWVHDAIK